MKESLLSRFKTAELVPLKKSKVSSDYFETYLKSNGESAKQFVAHLKKKTDEEVPSHVGVSTRGKRGSQKHVFSDSLGLEQNSMTVDLNSLNDPLIAEKEALKTAVFKLSSFESISKLKSSLPPIVTYGAIDKIRRVSPLKLRSAYYTDGMVYNWINRIVEYFLSAEPKIVCKDKSDQKIIDEWVVVNNFRELLKLQFQHKYNYGNAVWRWVDDAFGNPVNLYFIDPIFFDAKRNEMGRVIYGPDGEPVGYVQYLRSLESCEGLPKNRITYQSPIFDYQSGTSLIFKKNEVIHLRLNRLGDDWWGIGQLESTYVDILNKKNGEQGFAETLQSMGYPRLVGYSGDENHPPTAQKMDDLFDAIDDLDADSKVVLPHYDKIDILESTKMDKVVGQLEYLKDSVVTGLGGPKSLVTGSGEATNRSTLQDQKMWLERSLKMEQQDTSNEIRVKLLAPLAERLKLKGIPTLIWQEVSMESLESKVSRLVDLSKSGLVNPDDPALQEFIRDLEDLPTGSTVQKKIIKPSKKVVDKSKKQKSRVAGAVDDSKGS